MDLTYVMEYRFRQDADGSIWTDTSYDYPFWGRYLDVFDRISVVARALPEPPLPGWRRVDGPRVQVVPLPHYLGPVQYARRYFEINEAIRTALTTASAVILRIPSQLCTCAAEYLIETGHPFGVEVVGNPDEALSRGVTAHPMRPFFQWWYRRNQTKQCSRATTAVYVSSRLRDQYPPGPETIYADCSDVTLDEDAFRWPPRVWREEDLPSTLITVATLSQLYKGIDVLLDSLAICRADGLPLNLVIVGDGKYRALLEKKAEDLGLGRSVRFAGALLSGAPIRNELDQADVFVLPSRTEGMPRALLEAMARGLPCIASRVGGVPDVLQERDLVPPGDAAALANKIWEVFSNPSHMNWMAARNMETASAFRTESLRPSWRQLQVELSKRTDPFVREARAL